MNTLRSVHSKMLKHRLHSTYPHIPEQKRSCGVSSIMHFSYFIVWIRGGVPCWGASSYRHFLHWIALERGGALCWGTSSHRRFSHWIVWMRGGTLCWCTSSHRRYPHWTLWMRRAARCSRISTHGRFSDRSWHALPLLLLSLLLLTWYCIHILTAFWLTILCGFHCTPRKSRRPRLNGCWFKTLKIKGISNREGSPKLWVNCSYAYTLYDNHLYQVNNRKSNNKIWIFSMNVLFVFNVKVIQVFWSDFVLRRREHQECLYKIMWI